MDHAYICGQIWKSQIDYAGQQFRILPQWYNCYQILSASIFPTWLQWMRLLLRATMNFVITQSFYPWRYRQWSEIFVRQNVGGMLVETNIVNFMSALYICTIISVVSCVQWIDHCSLLHYLRSLKFIHLALLNYKI